MVKRGTICQHPDYGIVRYDGEPYGHTPPIARIVLVTTGEVKNCPQHELTPTAGRARER